ncbi:tripartite-type tricarboxylate transporter receptor subunit TctC [Variovorax sp. TBS-050B]|uniref:Bug family tripartite tricarboxylate transporter substrate binding protein n=1 Tax=Variovorax sp. TBS-050B TaxID=2940551 RepID=UPI002473470A|nr:tripartite tricarboxylate transporter substrate binding protein BugE [Variovorax sp. TBS-050B]MDH6594287.1 tripartite-type tricarboxylate transporter receptor subunit TctC [Variovorax sp. TBS-050B]
MNNRRDLLLAITAVAFGLPMASTDAHASSAFPDRPIKLIVPFPPGGSTDLVARLLAEKMSVVLGQQVVVENRGGAGGTIGISAVARAEPDGYTIGMATVSTHGANPAVYSKLPYDPVKDFQPITNVMSVPSVFVVSPKLPVKNMKEFIALAKSSPGKLTFASPGNGSLGHVNVEQFMDLAGIRLTHVPYKGAGQAAADALAGTVDAMTDNLPSSLPHIKSGKLRALAVLSPERSPLLPDVPTYRELGFESMSEGGWFGLVAPAGVPAPVIEKLMTSAHQAMQDPAFKQRTIDISGVPMANTPAQFAQQIREMMDKYARIAKVANIKL